MALYLYSGQPVGKKSECAISLEAVTLARKLGELCGQPVKVTYVFHNQTPAALAAALVADSLISDALSAGGRSGAAAERAPSISGQCHALFLHACPVDGVVSAVGSR